MAPLASAGAPHRVLMASACDEWRRQVRAALASSGVELLEAASGQEALAIVEKGEEPGVSVVIVDATLNDVSGLGLCRWLRESRPGAGLPILMVSRLAAEIDRVLAFETGVDDFLAWPFFARELDSRVRAVHRRDARRSGRDAGSECRHYGPLRVDLQRAAVEVDGRRVRLTAREFELLRQLVEHEGKVLERDRLLARGRPPDDAGLRVVDTHVKAIRRKLGCAREAIQTVRGVGYRFAPEFLAGDG